MKPVMPKPLMISKRPNPHDSYTEIVYDDIRKRPVRVMKVRC